MSVIYKDGQFYGGNNSIEEPVKVEVMPTADISLVGEVLMYVGETDSNYTNCYWYKCVSDTSTTPATYSWANVEVQNGTVSMELTQQEYDNLPDEQKSDGTVYYITDSIPFNPNSAVCGFTPVGTIISVMGNSAPRNYLACNGQVVDILDYPELAHYFEEQFGQVNKFGGNGTTTFGIPDLRGEFLRGTGTNSHENQGNGANVGTHQDATAMPYIGANTTGTKTLWTYSDKTSPGVSGGITPYSVDSIIYGESTTKGLQGANNSFSTQWSGANGITNYTAKPTNTSVLYCIATKNIYVKPKYDEMNLLYTTTQNSSSSIYTLPDNLSDYSYLLVKVNLVSGGTELGRGNQILVPVIEILHADDFAEGYIQVQSGGNGPGTTSNTGNFVGLFCNFTRTKWAYTYATYIGTTVTNPTYIFRLYGIY